MNRRDDPKRADIEARKRRPEPAPAGADEDPEIDPADFFDPEEFGIRRRDRRL